MIQEPEELLREQLKEFNSLLDATNEKIRQDLKKFKEEKDEKKQLINFFKKYFEIKNKKEIGVFIPKIINDKMVEVPYSGNVCYEEIINQTELGDKMLAQFNKVKNDCYKNCERNW